MKTDTEDPRRGMPSASGMERLMLCPGSWLLEQKCEDLPETQAQKDGTRLHEAMEKHDLKFCKDKEEEEACIWCNAMEDELVRQVFHGMQPADVASVREVRLWNNEQTFSGKPDVYYMHGNKVLVIDYKFGRKRVADVEENRQMMALAVLVGDNYQYADEVYCAVLQPFARGEGWCPPTVRYTREHLVRARRILADMVSMATGGYGCPPPRRGGEAQCKYCRAATICPEVNHEVALFAQPLAASWSALEPAQKRMIWERWKVCKAMGEQVEAQVRADLEEGREVDGLELAPGKRVFKVTNAQKAFSSLQDLLHVTGYDFSECCTVKMGELDKLAREMWQSKTETKGMTVAECKARLREVLEREGAGEWTQQAGSIKERRDD